MPLQTAHLTRIICQQAHLLHTEVRQNLGTHAVIPQIWRKTEPLIRLNLEATSRAEMERQRDEVLSIIRR